VTPVDVSKDDEAIGDAGDDQCGGGPENLGGAVYSYIVQRPAVSEATVFKRTEVPTAARDWPSPGSSTCARASST
jgi:hypothetical protein